MPFGSRHAGNIQVDGATLSALGHALARAGFGEGAVRETLEIEPWQVHSADWPLYEHAVHGRGAQFALALETWLFGEPIAHVRLEAWLGERLVESLTTCEILVGAGSDVQAQVQILPFAEFWVAGDADEGVLEPDLRVFNVAPSSVRLAQTLPRNPGGRALDLGTGAGVLALVLSRRSASVTAVDRSSAALSLARFNVLLNGAGNVDVCHGDWFNGLDDQRYSLIAANLPYTVSPGGSSAFDDSGLPGDAVSYRVLDDAHRYLDPDGRAYILCSWTLQQGWGGDATAPMMRRLERMKCDAVVLCQAVQDAATYARLKNGYLRNSWPDRYGERLRAWLRFFRETGTDAIATGLVVLRRSRVRSRGAVIGFAGVGEPGANSAEHVQLTLDAARWLADVRENPLLVRSVRLRPHRYVMTAANRQTASSANQVVAWIRDGAGIALGISEELQRLLARGQNERSELIVDLSRPSPVRDDIETAIAAGFLVPEGAT